MASGFQPAAVATWHFGRVAAQYAGERLAAGDSALNAVDCAISKIELDPALGDNTVGYGGLPNSEGVVQLDAAIMDGVTHMSGSVVSLEGHRSAIAIARRLLDEQIAGRTKHCLLAGAGASRFAASMGFPTEQTLSEEAANKFRAWKEGTLPPGPAIKPVPQSPHDTIGLVAIDAHGNLAAGCATSGLSFKYPGRVGDSALVGSGLYVDNDIGGAAATGIGEEIMKHCLSFAVVEKMGAGVSPTDACRMAIENAKRRIVRSGRRQQGMHFPEMAVIAMNKHGEAGGWSTRVEGFPRNYFSYAVWRKGAERVEETIVEPPEDP